MANLVPGHGLIGRGFNGFGQYNASAVSKKASLFDTHTPSSRTWKDPDTGVVYDLPANVGAHPVSAHLGSVEFFNDKAALSEFFSTQASVEGSYLAFSGQFEASFSAIRDSVSENLFGMFYLSTTGFNTEILAATRANLSPTVLSDPDFTQLPDELDESNAYLFFRFFNKYGTHFVKGVSMGGRLYYSVSIEKSYGFSEKELCSNIALEYKAVFGAKAEASANWKKLGSTWSDSRKVTISATGGDDSILNDLGTPTPGSNDSAGLEKWIDTIQHNPGPMSFTLVGVDTLFSGQQAEAVAAAMEAYTQKHLFMKALGGQSTEATSGSVILNGTPLPRPPFKDGGLTVAIIDRESLKVVAQGSFDVMKGFLNNNKNNPDYSGVMETVKPYTGDDSVIVAMLFWGMYSIWGPTGEVYDFILSLGAGAGLDKWSSHMEYPAWQDVAYSIVGIPGWVHGEALENYAVGFGSGSHNGDQRYPGLEMQVFLEPIRSENEFRYTPV